MSQNDSQTDYQKKTSASTISASPSPFNSYEETSSERSLRIIRSFPEYSSSFTILPPIPIRTQLFLYKNFIYPFYNDTPSFLKNLTR